MILSTFSLNPQNTIWTSIGISLVYTYVFYTYQRHLPPTRKKCAYPYIHTSVHHQITSPELLMVYIYIYIYIYACVSVCLCKGSIGR
ncbi:hypothetical protein F5X96DRAFT_656178 [Biscogniauxia mediterranea]|nr:hypothetical protein F5X96DRAFT_656178 [Biscogniauxia mediterranea]